MSTAQTIPAMVGMVALEMPLAIKIGSPVSYTVICWNTSIISVTVSELYSAEIPRITINLTKSLPDYSRKGRETGAKLLSRILNAQRHVAVI